MDDLTNRIMAVAFAFLWIFAIFIIILLVWSAPDESINRISDLAGYLDDHNNTETKLIITFGGTMLILLATLLILFEVVPPEGGALKIQQIGGGEAEIDAEEAALRVEEELRQVPGISQVQAKLVGRGKKAEVSLSLHVSADANLAQTADEASARASGFMEEKMGIQLAKPPSTDVHYRELHVSGDTPPARPEPSAPENPAASEPAQPSNPEPAQEQSDAPRDPASGA